MPDRWVSQVFRDAADRVARDPWMPTSSTARGCTRRAAIRPVRAVRTPVVVSATPGSGGAVVDMVGTPTTGRDDAAYLDHLQRLAGDGWRWPRRAGGWR